MSSYRSMSAARRRSSEPSGEAERNHIVEPKQPHEALTAVLAPLSAEVGRHAEVGDDTDRRFRLELEELMQDMSTGMTPHLGGRTVNAVQPGLKQWFDRREAVYQAKQNDLGAVIASMGKALKALQGDDEDFMGGLDANLSRLTQAADSVQVRHVSARLQQILEVTSEQAKEERDARDKRLNQLSTMVRGLHEQLDAAKIQLQEDALTGLYNRGTFDARLNAEINKCKLTPYKFSLIMIDLDHFKAVNDTHGHVGGDRVLQACAEAIKAIVMSTDDFCARYGGDEMAIIVSDSDMENGNRVAEAVRQRIESLEIQTGTAIHTQTASFGVSEGCDEDDPVDVLERADAALYAAKENGRNKVCVAGYDEARRVRLPKCQQRRSMGDKR